MSFRSETGAELRVTLGDLLDPALDNWGVERDIDQAFAASSICAVEFKHTKKQGFELLLRKGGLPAGINISTLSRLLPVDIVQSDKGKLELEFATFARTAPAGMQILQALATHTPVVFGCVSIDQAPGWSEVALSQLLLGILQNEKSTSLWWEDYFLFLAPASLDSSFDWRKLLRERQVPLPEKVLLKVRQSLYALSVTPEPTTKPNLPPGDLLRASISVVKELEQFVSDAQQRTALTTVISASEWLLLNGPVIARSQLVMDNQDATTKATKCPPSVSEIKTWQPEKFFGWFERAIVEFPRKELMKPVKAWLKAQEGKHDFSDLSPVDALKAKQDLARRVNDVLDSLGLSLICGKEDCGQRARLGAARKGSSVSGQFNFVHPAETPRSSHKHAASKFFPRLTIE